MPGSVVECHSKIIPTTQQHQQLYNRAISQSFTCGDLRNLEPPPSYNNSTENNISQSILNIRTLRILPQQSSANHQQIQSVNTVAIPKNGRFCFGILMVCSKKLNFSDNNLVVKNNNYKHKNILNKYLFLASFNIFGIINCRLAIIFIFNNIFSF